MVEFDKYLTELDAVDKDIVNKRVAEKGIEEYLTQQLIYLDCSRIINGMRMMQTIGYPYKREISSYLYALGTVSGYIEHEWDWIDKLENRHINNILYEKENPPIWYDGKPKKSSTRKHKVKEGDIFPKEPKRTRATKIEKAAAKLKSIGFATFKLNTSK